MKVLYTSEDVHKELKSIFSINGRRVAVVAYVGSTSSGDSIFNRLQAALAQFRLIAKVMGKKGEGGTV